MLILNSKMEEQIRVAMHELEHAQAADRERYTERLIGKLEFAFEVGIKEDVSALVVKKIFEDISTPNDEASEPEEQKAKPMSPEDIANVDIVVKKKPGKKKAEKEENDFTRTRKLMKAGKNLKEIAEETGKTLAEAQADVRKVQEQEAK